MIRECFFHYASSLIILFIHQFPPLTPSQVDIWEERKVFGSRGRSLKDEMLGKNPPVSVSNGKSSIPIKIVKRDAHSVRIVRT